MRGETVVSLGGPYPEPTTPFGGVVRDVEAIQVPFGILLLADLPFSLVGDIATLPCAMRVHWLESEADKLRQSDWARTAATAGFPGMDVPGDEVDRGNSEIRGISP